MKKIPGIISWCEQRLPERENIDMEDDDGNHIFLIIDIFEQINMVMESYDNGMI